MISPISSFFGAIEPEPARALGTAESDAYASMPSHAPIAGPIAFGGVIGALAGITVGAIMGTWEAAYTSDGAPILTAGMAGAVAGAVVGAGAAAIGSVVGAAAERHAAAKITAGGSSA